MIGRALAVQERAHFGLDLVPRDASEQGQREHLSSALGVVGMTCEDSVNSAEGPMQEVLPTWGSPSSRIRVRTFGGTNAFWWTERHEGSVRHDGRAERVEVMRHDPTRNDARRVATDQDRAGPRGTFYVGGDQGAPVLRHAGLLALQGAVIA